MAQAKVEIPWETVGQLLGSFQAQLNENLRATGHSETTAYLEITLYSQLEGDEVPRAEYNLGGGEIGKRLPIDDDIKEDEETSEYMDYQEGEIDRILRDLYIQLDKTIMEYSGANYLIRPGVRALIYSPNPGYSCRGYRCEWRASHNGWYLRYYYSQNDTCRKRWTNTACR